MSENKSLSQSLNIDKRKALDTIKKILDDNDIGYRISNTESINWINNIPSPVWGYDLGIHVDELLRANQVLRSALDPLGFTTGMDNYNNAIWIKQKPVINEYNIYNDFVEYITEEAEYSEINHYPVFIILQHNGTRLGNIIKKVTKDEYTHACISFNSALSPIYSFGLKKGEVTGKENGSGLVIQSGPTAPFYLERKSTYSIYVMYVNKEQYENMQKTLKWFVKRRDKIGFDIPSLILNWLEKPSEKSKKYFCSRFVAEIINAGYKLDKVPSLWRPEDFKSLSNITLVDKGNDFKKYSKDIVDNNIELVKQYRYNFIKFNESVEEKEVYDPLGSTLMTNNEVPFDLPDIEDISKPDITTLLNNTPEDRIFLTSDWHFFKNHYKKEHNYVNTREILDWCRKNIKEDDVFIYLGDLSFRYANKLDQAKSQEYMSSIKGHKIFVLGNHDKMLGSDYFTKCGFDYVVEEFSWRNYIFTHRPVNMSTFPSDWVNIHGHIHNIRKYNTTDGKRNVNVYPYFFDNKPTTFKYVSTHVEELVKDNEWNWNAGYGEAAISSASYINESNIDEYKYYHLSKESDLSIVEPSIPDNYMTKNKFEDHKTKRVCFAPSINQCLMAISRNLTGETFYVYTLYESDYKKIKKPSVNQVPDVNITGEVWITEPVKVKYIGKIRVTGASTNDGYSYMYGDDKKHKAELYDWDYTVIAENYMSNANILNYIKEQTALINKPKSLVYYSNFVDSKIIAYMVSLFRNRLGSRVAIKLHFGEDGNTNFLNPKYLKDLVRITNGALVDSNTAYAGSTRGDTQSHIATARKHGFGFGYIDILDADGEINLGVPKRFKIQQDMDDLAFGRKKSYEIPVTNGVHLQEISVGSHIKNYDSMVVYTHFKGHDIAGYGGSIKNIGMGIPSKNGKLQIHGKNFEVGGPLFLERLVESASAIESIFDGRVVYVNILQNMSTKCDCDKDAPKAKIPDVGVLVSDNIVAIEQASIDFIRNSPKNKDLMEQISNRGGTHQIEYADYLGMGNRQYILKNVHNNERLQLENTSILDALSYSSKVFNENYVLPMPDIKYNKEKFDSGKTNLLFITGLSGAGKSTLSLDIGDDCEVVPLDAVIWNKTYINLDEIKQISPMAFEFFNGEGNKYYVSMKEINNGPAKHNNYMKDLICDFVDFAIKYAKDHKDQKYVIEGVYIYECIDPKLLKDYAVYIKGTSAVTSLVRAGKRDNKLINNILKPGFWLSDEPRLNKFRKYFMALMKSHKESALLEVKRSELPDSAFGIPEDRKFPLDTEKHVRSAIHLFGHAEESKKKNLAHRIASAAKKYGITIPETTQCYKYLNEGALFDIIPQDRDTIIFDMGNVLVDAHTIDALLNNPDIPDEYVYDIRDFVYEHFFYNETNKHEIQQYNIPQAKAYYMKNAPEHIKAYVDSVFDTFKPAMFTYDYAYDMIEFFRSRGYKLYYLSNWDRYSYECEKEFFAPLLSKFDGGLFSFQTPYIKPELNIYTKLLKDYNIDPNKAVFLDDRQENLDTAKMLGIYPVKFDKNITPKQIMGDAIVIPKDTDNILLVRTDRGLDSVNIHSITWWYICENRYPSEVDEELYYKSLEDCVRIKYGTLNNNNAFTDEYPYVEEYVFINSFCIDKNKVPKLCPVGKILIYASGGYEWEIQYPLRFENGEFKSIKEYAMNAVNPVIGIVKPYVLIAQDSRGIQQPVLSPDMENDKYLTVNENGKFSIVKSNRYTIKAIYEFVGNPAYVDRLSYRYKDKNYVSEGIYTELTGRDLLSIDQFDTDPSFKKIDVDLLEQKAISEVVTLKHQIKKYTNRTIYNHPLIESYMTKIPEFVHRYNKFGDIKLMEDFDGVYFYSTLTEKRSGSVATPSLLTENMLKAIL